MIVTDDYRTIVFRPADLAFADIHECEYEEDGPRQTVGNVVALGKNKGFMIRLVYNKSFDFEGQEYMDSESLFFQDEKKAQSVLRSINKQLNVVKD